MQITRAIVAATLLFLLSGCVAGKWKLESVTPESAKAYTVADFTLHSDGTYTAVVDRGQGPMPADGAYSYENGKLTFTPSEGGTPRTYDAELIVLGHKLRMIAAGPKGETVTAIMVRQ